MKKDLKLHNLSPEEERVIVHKWTEALFTWQLLEEKREGTFVCKQCDAPLYYSDMKFDSGCGWPSFDDAIPWQVHEYVDADGRRVEITCKTCGGHLGHVFRGEQITDKDTRHCVNSVSMRFIPEKVDMAQHAVENTADVATFGWGCYRCVEAVIQRLRGVIQVESWYMWGTTEDPTYGDVAHSQNDHIEVVHVHYDPDVITYQTLLNVFFSSHDPTQIDRQGNDVGPQYASVIFTHTLEQKEQAENMIQQLNTSKVYAPDIVATQVREASEFWKWPDYHQEYYNKNKTARYCEFIINPKVKKLRDMYSDLLKDEYEDEIDSF